MILFPVTAATCKFKVKVLALTDEQAATEFSTYIRSLRRNDAMSIGRIAYGKLKTVFNDKLGDFRINRIDHFILSWDRKVPEREKVRSIYFLEQTRQTRS